MSTEILKQRPLVDDIRTARTRGWLNLRWKAVLNKKKQLIFGVAAVAVLAVAGHYFWGNQSSAPQYMTAKVERGNLRNTVTATGTLQAVTTVQVGSQASGTLSALNADFNSVVKKGQIIAQLDPAVAKAQVDQARANVQQARASLQQLIASVAGSRAGAVAGRSGASAPAHRHDRQHASRGVLHRQALSARGSRIAAWFARIACLRNGSACQNGSCGDATNPRFGQ